MPSVINSIGGGDTHTRTHTHTHKHTHTHTHTHTQTHTQTHTYRCLHRNNFKKPGVHGCKPDLKIRVFVNILQLQIVTYLRVPHKNCL